MNSPARSEFLERLYAAMEDGTLIRLHLGAPAVGHRELKQVLIRPTQIRNRPHLTFVYRHATRDITKNYEPLEARTLIEDLLGVDFRSAFLSTTAFVANLHLQKGRSQKLILAPPETVKKPPLTHDQSRNRSLQPSEPWLIALGISDLQGRVRAGKEAKFRQIHRFVELLDHWLPPQALSEIAPSTLPENRHWTLVDMGCGKGYLTFAAHQFLRRRWGDQVRTLGIEQRPDLVRNAERAASECGLEGLSFQPGTIESAAFSTTQILVALHACDTATDDALARGVLCGAQWVMVAPCCHNEIRSQLRAPPGMTEALRHGILKERQAEWVTDALRAALMEAAGFHTRVFEFISPEHTSKNLMITAERTAPTHPQSIRPDRMPSVQSLSSAFGIQHQRLAQLLDIPLQDASTDATPSNRSGDGTASGSCSQPSDPS